MVFARRRMREKERLDRDLFGERFKAFDDGHRHRRHRRIGQELANDAVVARRRHRLGRRFGRGMLMPQRLLPMVVSRMMPTGGSMRSVAARRVQMHMPNRSRRVGHHKDSQHQRRPTT